MSDFVKNSISRRKFIKNSTSAVAGLSLMPFFNCAKIGVSQVMKRPFGLLDFDVTSLGLGG